MTIANYAMLGIPIAVLVEIGVVNPAGAALLVTSFEITHKH